MELYHHSHYKPSWCVYGQFYLLFFYGIYLRDCDISTHTNIRRTQYGILLIDQKTTECFIFYCNGEVKQACPCSGIFALCKRLHSTLVESGPVYCADVYRE